MQDLIVIQCVVIRIWNITKIEEELQMKQNSMTDDQKALLVALRKGSAVAERTKENWSDEG